MSEIRIGWFGDSQLDYAQYGLSRRRDDFIDAVDSALADMVSRGIRHIVHAGDFMQSNRPSPYTMFRLHKTQRFLRDNNALVYVISGNHDNARPHWVDIINGGELDGFQLIDHVMVPVVGPDHLPGVSIFGLPNMSREEFLKVEFKPADILVMHQSVTQFIDFPASNAIDVSELPFDKYRVIAIGDIHIYRIDPIHQLLPLKAANFNCLVGYAGATELNSSSEPDEKYWVELTFDSEAPLALPFWTSHVIKTRPIIRLTIKEAGKLDEALDAAKARVAEAKSRDSREPIMFIDYNSQIPDVVDRFRKNFDPDKFILRLNPVFYVEQSTELVGAPKADMSISDLLKSEIPETSNLYSLASQLFNPDLESEHIGAAVDTYIEERLNQNATSTINA